MAILFEEKKREYISRFEQALGQKIPINDRSFLSILASVLASIFISILKKADFARLENLATTASRNGLTEIGRGELGRDPFPAQNSVIEIVSTYGTPGVVIPEGTEFISDYNGLTYVTTAPYTQSPILANLIAVTSELAGASTNLPFNTILTLKTPIIGVIDDWQVSNTNTTGTAKTGTDEEGTEEYRQKVLDRMRSQGGGSNLSDYRDWSQEVNGVKRAYPYGGAFDDYGDIDPVLGVPSSRTVFVQATEDIDEDGIAPQSLIDAVRSSLITDPSDGRNRICLGVPDSTLYVVSIKRVSFDVKVFGTDSSWDSQAKPSVETALENYFQSLIPSIEGLDPVAGRVDSISEVSISSVVDSSTAEFGKTASTVTFSLSGEAGSIEKYSIPAGTLLKLGTVEFL